MERAIFSSSDLSPQLNEKAKFSLWQEIHNDQVWSVEYDIAENRPFEAVIEALPIGQVVLGEMAGTIKQANRTARHIADDGRDGYLLLVNLGQSALNGTQMRRDYCIERGEAALVSASESLTMIGGDRNVWSNLVLPANILTAAFANIDDKLAIPVNADQEALGLLRGYSRLLETGKELRSPELIAHVTTTLVDLVGLVIGAKGEPAELAELRGLRAARLQVILARIRTEYTNPEISAQRVARTLGLSPSYIHDLLQETGMSFSEHVLELRLQKAAQMLSDRICDNMRISEIAYMVGFGDVSYFNRCFRRRFGCAPRHFR